MRGVIYLVHSGFDLLFLEKTSSEYTLSAIKRSSTFNWKYLVLVKKIVSFPIVFKYLFEKENPGLHYVRIRFREQLHKPIELLAYTEYPRTLYILDSNPGFTTILKRILANPRFSDTVVLMAELSQGVRDILEKYSELTKIARRLYLELGSLFYRENLGKLELLKIAEQRKGELDVDSCVSKKGVYLEIIYNNVKVHVKDVESCLVQ